MPELQYQELMEPVARYLLGEPNARLSKPDELRFGTHGSVAVDLATGTFYDHEANEGGGVLDLVRLKSDSTKTRTDAAKWLERAGFLNGVKKSNGHDQNLKNTNQQKTPHTCLELEPSHEVMKSWPQAQQPASTVVATYDYCDEAGALVFQVLRYEPKTFRQRRPEGSGWSWSVKGVRVLPYRLSALLADPAATVFLVEGEKDADRLAALGLVATCNAGGAGKWKKEHSEFLRARRVVVLPDNDEAGEKHAQQVERSLRGIAAEVRTLVLPGLPDKGDVSDWLDAGGTLEELLALASTDAATSATQQAEDEASGRKRGQTDLLVAFVRERFALLHDKNGDTYAQDHSTGEVARTAGRQFKDRVTAAFFQQHGLAVREQAWREALTTVQALARYEGELQAVHIRVAGSDGRYWVDLCQPGNSRAVEIDAQGWRIVQRAPVVFVRSESMQPMPDPVHGGSIDTLWSIANVPEAMRPLVLAWLLDCLRPDTPFPGLELVGEQGSGKSTTAEALRRLIDPSGCNLRSAPKSIEDVFVAAGQNHVVAYENISHLSAPMQDALAILSTGGGFAKRQLFTDADEHVINVRRPWLVNGISICVTQQDLVDRVISVECPVIEVRQSSSQQWQAFEAQLPQLLGALYSLAAAALHELPRVHLAKTDRPRLVEYVTLGMAMHQANEEDANEFLAQFKKTRIEAVARTLDASPVACAVTEFLECNPQGIDAPVKVILKRLEDFKPMGADAWPRSPKGLGDALRRAAPALRQLGIECKSMGNIGGKVHWALRHTARATAEVTL
mgnify:CR=1 FL=1